MNKYLVIVMILPLLAIGFTSAEGHSSFGYPLGDNDNVSYHPDWNKGPNTPRIGSYGWIDSSICGVQICEEINVVPAIAGESNLGETVNEYPKDESRAYTQKSTEWFDGKFYIKGLFPY